MISNSNERLTRQFTGLNWLAMLVVWLVYQFWMFIQGKTRSRRRLAFHSSPQELHWLSRFFAIYAIWLLFTSPMHSSIMSVKLRIILTPSESVGTTNRSSITPMTLIRTASDYSITPTASTSITVHRRAYSWWKSPTCTSANTPAMWRSTPRTRWSRRATSTSNYRWTRWTNTTNRWACITKRSWGN